MRIHIQERSRWRSLCYLLLFPLLPALMTDRAARYAIAGTCLEVVSNISSAACGGYCMVPGRSEKSLSGLCRH